MWFVVVAIFKLPLPSKEPEPVTEPVNEIVLAVASLVAVAAFPVVPFAIFPVIATGLPLEK